MYIYKTTNIINGKFYIGKRVYRKKDDDWYIGSGIYLKRAIIKYGRENFKKEIIEWCLDEQHLSQREIYWIKFYDATSKGYNLSLGGDGGNVGKEAYIKIGNKLRGIAKPKEFGKKISIALKGVPKSEETKDKIRQTLTGTKRPDSVISKMSISMKEKYDNGWISPAQKTVYQYVKGTNILIAEYKSATDAGRILNIDRKGITNNCNLKTKSSGGFTWSSIKHESSKL